jgi:hypothetical protein
LTGLENLLTLFKASLNNRKWRLAVFWFPKKEKGETLIV